MTLGEALMRWRVERVSVERVVHAWRGQRRGTMSERVRYEVTTGIATSQWP